MKPLLIGRIWMPTDPEVRRVLVDRLWPRGFRKDGAAWDTWLKDMAPSTELRKWYGHDLERYSEFRGRYWRELEQVADEPGMQDLLSLWADRAVALLTASKIVDRGHVPVLRDFLLSIASAGPRQSD